MLIQILMLTALLFIIYLFLQFISHFIQLRKKTDLSVLMLHHLCNMLLENYEAKRPFKLTIL